MKNIKIQQHYAHPYTATNHPEIIDAENANFISIEGRGSFTEELFYQQIFFLKLAAQAVADLFHKSEKAFELSVLEGLYWNDEKYGPHTISEIFGAGPLSELNYRLMIRLPDYVTDQHILSAREDLNFSNKEMSNKIAFFEYQEGKCIQMLHKGAFIEEFKTLGKLEQFAKEYNLIKRGVHHEIYLVDFTTGGSQKNLSTILREPVK